MTNRVTVRVWNPATDDWPTYGGRIVDMERATFGEGSFSEEYLASEFRDRRNMRAVLCDGDELIGFTLASPVSAVHPCRSAAAYDTAYVTDTVIREDWRGKKLIGTLMAALEAEMRLRGFRFFERDAATAFGYSDSIRRAYSERIVYEEGPHDSEWGPQVFFRIRL